MDEQTPEREVKEADLRKALLAKLRRDLILSKLDTLQIERLGVALKHGLINVHQCLALQHGHTGVLGI